MKKIWLLLLLWVVPAQAQVDFLENEEMSVAEEKSESPDEVVNEYITDLENAVRVKNDARKILLQKDDKITLRENQKKQIEEGNKKRELLRRKINSENIETPEENVKIAEKNDEQQEFLRNSLEKAPFGLFWKATAENMNLLGFSLTEVQREGYENVYKISKENQPLEDFEFVTVSFGKQNRLWNIYAQGLPEEDDNKASKIMVLYEKYYNALDKKYGNAQQFFQPYVIEQKISEKKDGAETEKIVKKEHKIGNDDFLEELKTEKAILYATFSDGKIGVVLSVGVDDNGRSYITLDYKNLELLRKENEQNMQEILENL